MLGLQSTCLKEDVHFNFPGWCQLNAFARYQISK